MQYVYLHREGTENVLGIPQNCMLPFLDADFKGGL